MAEKQKTTAGEPEPFDITDGRNRYEPCPVCKRDFGMGLRTRNGQCFVWCANCDCEGPGLPEEQDGAEKRAFDAWNEHSRDCVDNIRQD